MKRATFFILKILYAFFILIPFFFLSTCESFSNSTNQTASPDSISIASIPPLKVDTVWAKKRKIASELSATARVYMAQEVELSFQTGGMITQFRLNEGKYVKKGELLARLDTIELSLQKEKIMAALAKADIDKKDWMILYGGTETDSLSKEKIRMAKIASGYMQLETDLKLIEYKLSNCNLVAPYSGIIADVKSTAFQQIQGGEPIARLINLKEPMLRVGILERELNQVKKGQRALVGISAFPEEEFKARLTYISPYVDENGLIYIHFKILNSNGRIYPGMQAEAQILLDPGEETIVVPIDAVVSRAGKSIVFIYKQGHAKWTYVETGRKNAEFIEILRGVEFNDPLIVTQHINIAHDIKVIVNK